MARTKYWVWLSTVPGLGPLQKTRLLRLFGEPDKIFFAEREQLLACPGITEKEAEKLADKDMERVNRVLAACEEKHISILTLQDAEYPERLRNIPDPPAALYLRGRLPPLDDLPVVAVVGTRRVTPYGLKMAGQLGRELAEGGAVVVSGLAAGADAAAMDAALRAGGTVVGVLGTAIDQVYPRSSALLFRETAVRGLLMSEYAPGERTYPSDFKVRNRIIAGLSLGVLVVEAPERSGALVTAAHALEQNRDVFAVPGNADAVACAGTNRLIAEGAVPVCRGEDILEVYRRGYTPFFPKTRATPIKKEIDKPVDVLYIDLVEKLKVLPEPQRSVALALTDAPQSADDIIEKTGLPAQRVLTALTLLQIAGLARQEGGKRFSLRKG